MIIIKQNKYGFVVADKEVARQKTVPLKKRVKNVGKKDKSLLCSRKRELDRFRVDNGFAGRRY